MYFPLFCLCSVKICMIWNFLGVELEYAMAFTTIKFLVVYAFPLYSMMLT
jgi:hypothetical protein